MTGLADAYTDDVGALQSPGRLQAGAVLLGVGTFLSIAALLAAVANPTDLHTRRIAGVLGGLAAPALVGGVVAILPANPKLRAAAAIGASITLLGVASFWHAYPDHWAGFGRELTAYVTGIYFTGMLTLVCCCFAGIATFKRRNDPGGTVSLTVGQGETKVVTVTEQVGGIGGVGLLGGTPDETVETQTNRPDRSSASSASSDSGRSSGRSHGRSAHSDTKPSPSSGSGDGATAGGGSGAGRGHGGPSASTTGAGSTRGAVSDGGADAEQLRSPAPSEGASGRPSADVADSYCGNCEHFQYVRTEQGMTPYCGLTSEYMEDMEACEDWTPNA